MRRKLLLIVGALVLVALVAGVVVLSVRPDIDKPQASKSAGSKLAAFQPDATSLEDCAKPDAKPLCDEQALGNVAYDEGAKAAIAIFDEKMKTDPKIEGNCHRIAHAVGAGALLRNDGDVGKTFAEGSSICWSGYYHGILERAFHKVPDDELGKVSNELCASDSVRDTRFLFFQCVHGLGHGLMIYTSYDLPKSLEVCESLEDNWQQQSCDGGVFMENISSSYGITSKYLSETDPEVPCATQPDRHKTYCYMMMTSRALEVYASDWKKVANACARVKGDQWKALCFQSFGRDASGRSRSVALEVKRLCAIAGAGESECVYGAVRDMVSQDTGPARASKFCQVLDADVQARCFEGMGTILGDLHPDAADVHSECAKFAVGFQRECAHGAGVAPAA